jgi:putative membrane protein
MHRAARSLIIAGACAAIAACAKSQNKTDSAAAADSAARAAAAAAPAPTPTAAAPALTDANILALLDEANAADSAGGNLASTKGTSTSVKEFGRTMMRDHHRLRAAGKALATKISVTPAPPANDTLPASAQKMADSMKAMAKGPAWDQAYIGHEVAVHQSVLALLQAAQGAAQDTSLRALITTAIPNIEAHLKSAQNIQTKLGSSASAAPPAGGMAAESTKKMTADSTKKGGKKY